MALGAFGRTRPSVMPGTVYCVYRARNAAHVLRLIKPALAASYGVHLWALDVRVAALEPWTRGAGRGWKFDLTNQLVAAAPPSGPMVMTDDDVAFTRGDVVALCGRVSLAGLDIAQPAHDRHSAASYRFTLARRFGGVRETTFVEIGPLVVFSERAQQHVLPFPAGLEMGWGLELDWHELQQQGTVRLGIVDALPVRHLGEISSDYDRAVAQAALDERCRARGITDLKEVQRTVRLFRRWPGPRW